MRSVLSVCLWTLLPACITLAWFAPSSVRSRSDRHVKPVRIRGCVWMPRDGRTSVPTSIEARGTDALIPRNPQECACAGAKAMLRAQRDRGKVEVVQPGQIVRYRKLTQTPSIVGDR